MPRRYFNNAYKNQTNEWHHYSETPRGKQEQKIEFFCEKLKYAFLWRLRRKRRG